MPFQNEVSFKNAQLVPKPVSTDKLTPVTAHSRLKKCMHKTLIRQKLLAPWISFYRLDGLKNVATTELAATINVWNTTPNGIFVFVPENWLVIYYEHSHRQSILEADFCIFAFVYDEAVSVSVYLGTAINKH